MPVATVLRMSLADLAKARRAMEGRNDKLSVTYNYLSGQDFKNRLTGIVDGFIEMQKDLDKEKRAIQGQWAKRERQIQQVAMNTAGLYGDLQGIIGGTLPEIEGLGLRQLTVDETLAE